VIDWTRIARSAALAAWGAFFVYLQIGGHAARYVGPKTAWVVLVGAVTLPLIAAASLAGVHARGRTPTHRELGGLALLVTPIVLAIMVPAPSLGALAVANKSGGRAPVPQDGSHDGRVRLYEIAWAAESARYAASNGVRPGMRVDFTGFVSKAGAPLGLSRFFVTCCAADAIAYSVKVKPPAGTPSFGDDTWVRVRGTLTGHPGSTLAVAATAIGEIPAPSNPYN
jgi:uncharacterized repeat protein (TIGR03943 family)